MSTIHKRVFNLRTTSHFNATEYQDSEAHHWLVALMAQIARQRPAQEHATDGPAVTVIIEVIES